MKITLHYMGQLRTVCGQSSEHVDVGEGASLWSVLRSRADHYGQAFSDIVLDDAGHPRPSILVVVDDDLVDKRNDTPLSDGQAVRLLTAIAGG